MPGLVRCTNPGIVRNGMAQTLFRLCHHPPHCYSGFFLLNIFLYILCMYGTIASCLLSWCHLGICMINSIAITRSFKISMQSYAMSNEATHLSSVCSSICQVHSLTYSVDIFTPLAFRHSVDSVFNSFVITARMISF